MNLQPIKIETDSQGITTISIYVTGKWTEIKSFHSSRFFFEVQVEGLYIPGKLIAKDSSIVESAPIPR